MTRLFLVICLFYISIATISCNAQNTLCSTYGITWGVSHNNVYDHINEAKFNSRINYILLGLYYEQYFNSPKNFLKYELEYIHKGPYRFDINYLVLSSLWSRRLGKKNRISVLLGTYVGYMFRYIGRGKILNLPETKNYDCGLNFGFDFIISKKIPLTFSPRLELGLMRFSLSRHRVLEFKLSYPLNRKGKKESKKRRRK